MEAPGQLLGELLLVASRPPVGDELLGPGGGHVDFRMHSLTGACERLYFFCSSRRRHTSCSGVSWAREHAPIPFDEHQPACRSGQRILRWITVNVQDVGCIARPASVHHVESVFANAARYDGANRDAGLDDRVQAILPVADTPDIIKLYCFARQSPLTAEDVLFSMTRAAAPTSPPTSTTATVAGSSPRTPAARSTAITSTSIAVRRTAPPRKAITSPTSGSM